MSTVIADSRPLLPKPLPQPDAPGPMSEEEFVNWSNPGTWAEWVDGEVIVMAAAVRYDHADIVTFLVSLTRVYAEEKNLGKVLTEPFQIRFAGLKRRRSPDLLFVSSARLEHFHPAHFEGAPDLIMEVVSNESQSRDRRDKYLEYQAAGVREYWIIDPLMRQVELHVLDQSGTYQQVGEMNGSMRSTVMPGYFLRPAWLWQLQLPSVLQAFREITA